MTTEEFTALCDHLRKDRPELVALVNKDIRTKFIMETLSTLIRQCNEFIENRDFIPTDSEKRFFCSMSDYAITQNQFLDMLQKSLSLKLRTARED